MDIHIIRVFADTFFPKERRKFWQTIVFRDTQSTAATRASGLVRVAQLRSNTHYVGERYGTSWYKLGLGTGVCLHSTR